MLKRFLQLLLISVLLFSTMPVFAEESKNNQKELILSENKINENMDFVFRDYKEILKNCDTQIKESKENSSFKNVVLAVTRLYDGNIYKLTIYDDSAYSKTVLLRDSNSSEFHNGSNSGNNYYNCSAYGYITGSYNGYTYSGGILGDSINYNLFSGFTSYGTYYQTKLADNLMHSCNITSSSSSYIRVKGYGEAYCPVWQNGELVTDFIEKPIYLSVSFSSGSTPSTSISF